MPVSTRRSHKKSRHGCQQCKRNRTKCDEKKPSCSRCLRLGTECSLLDPSSALIIINGSTSRKRHEHVEIEHLPTPASQEESTCSPSDTEPQLNSPNLVLPTVFASVNYQPQIAQSEFDRLRLMTHYVRSAAQSIIDLTLATAEGQSAWRDSVPYLAFKNDYLMHGLLSVSALHQALSDPSTRSKNRVLAIEHHNHGLAMYSHHLQNITKENVDVLFGFAGFTALYSFGIHLTSDLKLSPLAKIHEVFTMIGGTGGIVQHGKEWLQQGIWSSWFGIKAWTFEGELPADIEEVIARLISRIDTTITTSSQHVMYSAMINALKRNLAHSLLRQQSQLSLVLLPVSAPPEFVQMICIAEPLALAILANWAIVLHWMRNRIWLQDWGLQTVNAVRDVIPSEWYDCIEWAVKEIENPPFMRKSPIELPDKAAGTSCHQGGAGIRG